MSVSRNRRQFLKSAAAGSSLFALGDLSFLSHLPPVSAAEAELDPNLVRFQPELEPLVRLLEDTPRETLLEEVAAKIHSGTTYREVLAALLLAGVRNVQPRPSVGFKFHAVLVVNSAHLASLASTDSDRWLPIFWALDYFKNAQADEARRSGWQMAAVDEQRVPSARNARKAFIDAMESWDAEAADAAVAGLVRTAGANELFELFCRYGARDYRSIGHKAIFVANSWRALQCIGWQYAEPVLRSLAFALVNHSGEPNPAKSDLPADHPWRRNQELAAKIPDEWREGKPNDDATRDLLDVLRNGSNDDACDKAVELLAGGIAPQSLWDAVLVGSGELLMRQPGIIGLHTLTTANALHYAYEAAGDDHSRRLLLLQSCAFVPMFRGSAQGRGKLKEISVDELQPIQPEQSDPSGAVSEIFADVSQDRSQAAGKIRAYLEANNSPEDLVHAARQLIFLKGNDAHDYKFSSAVLEDCYHVSPQWRPLFLATSVFNLPGSGDRDSQLVQRTREAMRRRNT